MPPILPVILSFLPWLMSPLRTLPPSPPPVVALLA